MSTVQVTKTCSKATYEGLDALAKFVAVVKEQLANGWQASQDIPPILASAVKDLGGTIGSLGDIGAEASAGGQEFQNALGIGTAEILGSLRK